MLVRPGLIRGKKAAGSILMVTAGTLNSAFSVTRTQSNSGLSSAVNAAETDLDFYAASTPRFTRSLRGLIVEGGRTNLVLNSATGVTQDCTVTAAAHTISFEGTGTVTWSGVAAGSLVGVGVGIANRVTSTFTPTAGTLTLTITGTVTRLQLEAGAFASTYIQTGGSVSLRNSETVSATVGALRVPSNGTHTVLMRIRTSLLAVNRGWFVINDGTANNRIALRNTNGTRNITILRTTAAAGLSSATVGTYTDNTLFNIGLTSLGDGNCSASFDGAAAVTLAGAPTSGFTTVQLGQVGGGNEYMFNTEIIKAQIQGTSMTDADLATATAAFA
jgi:hypothetical protein